mgnify:CR=1 FL=1
MMVVGHRVKEGARARMVRAHFSKRGCLSPNVYPTADGVKGMSAVLLIFLGGRAARPRRALSAFRPLRTACTWVVFVLVLVKTKCAHFPALRGWGSRAKSTRRRLAERWHDYPTPRHAPFPLASYSLPCHIE